MAAKKNTYAQQQEEKNENSKTHNELGGLTRYILRAWEIGEDTESITRRDLLAGEVAMCHSTNLLHI